MSDWCSDVCSSDLLGAAGDMATGADAGYQHVDWAVLEIGEDFFRRRAQVDIDIGVIFELLRHPGAGRGFDQLDRALDRALHALFARRQVEGRAISQHQPPPLDRDRKSVAQGKSVSVRVYLGGRRIVKKKRKS